MDESDQKAVVLEYASKGEREPRWYGPEWWAMVVIVVLGFFWLMCPVSCRTGPRELVHRRSCASNLKGVAMSCLTYAEANRGVFPASLEVLLEGGECAYIGNPKQLICPESGHRYVYVPGQTNTYDPRNVLVYEPISYHEGKGGNMAFIDGHAKWHKPDAYFQTLRETGERLALTRRIAELRRFWKMRTCVNTPDQSN